MGDDLRHVQPPCSACGVCAAICPHALPTMEFHDVLGTFLPSADVTTCAKKCGLCATVCPLGGKGPSARDINRSAYGQDPQAHFDLELGFFRNCYLGHSEANRLASASGGLLTWVGEKLLKAQRVAGVICVTPDETSPTLFRFTVARTLPELRAASGSCYLPVHAADVLRQTLAEEGNFALVALPCLAMAVRLAQRASPVLRSRIRYILALVCGGPRTRQFVDYVSSIYMGAQNPSRVEFRAKWPDSRAQQRYRFQYRSADGKGTERRAAFAGPIARTWASSLFAAECRTVCDDVFALAADAVFMDAWLPEHSSDWRGHTIAVARHPEIDDILRSGPWNGAQTAPIAPAEVVRSQAPLVREKRVRRFMRARASGQPTNGRPPAWMDRIAVYLQDFIRATGMFVWRHSRSYSVVRASVWLPTHLFRLCGAVQRRKGV